MKILVDENVAKAACDALRNALPQHTVHSVHGLDWQAKSDTALLRDAGVRGYEVFVTNDLRQRHVEKEMKAIRAARLHHVVFECGNGPDEVAESTAVLCHAMPSLLKALEGLADYQLCNLRKLSTSKAYEMRPMSTRR